jgi:hypothetical protein
VAAIAADYAFGSNPPYGPARYVEFDEYLGGLISAAENASSIS